MHIRNRASVFRSRRRNRNPLRRDFWFDRKSMGERESGIAMGSWNGSF